MHAALPQPVPNVHQRVAPRGVDAGQAAHVQDEEELGCHRRRPPPSLPPLLPTRNGALLISGAAFSRPQFRSQFLKGRLDGGLRLGRVGEVEVPVEPERGDTLCRVDVLVELGAEVKVGVVCLFRDLDYRVERDAYG